MTQASLSPDLESTIQGAPDPDMRSNLRLGTEATLWLFGGTALTLVFASLLLLGLLAQNVLADPAVSGAVTATAAITAMLGLGALAFVLSSARRAGLLGEAEAEEDRPTAQPGIASGLVVAPTIVPDPGASKRRAVEAQRDVRRQQARAIHTAGSANRTRSTVSRPPSPVRPPAPRPVTAPGAPPAHVAPRPTAPATVRPRPPLPIRARPTMPAAPRPVVRMPQSSARPAPVAPAFLRMPQSSARPAPVAPAFLRMSRPPMNAHTRTTMLQLQAAASRPTAAPAPWSIVEVPGRAPVYRPPRPTRAA